MINRQDRHILRELAKSVREIAALPVMAERKELWKKHNRLERVRPMLLVFPEGSWDELLPRAALRCSGEKARKTEWELRRRLYYHAHIRDDTVIENTWTVNKIINHSDSGSLSFIDWGMEPKYREQTRHKGSWGFDPVIRESGDLKKLKFTTVEYDAQGTAEALEFARELFGDILEVRLKGISHVSFHLMSVYIKLRGLEQVMWDMYDAPEMLHAAMSFLEAGYRHVIKQCTDQNLFSLNNDGAYHSSGGVGYTAELPAENFDPSRVRPRDMWASAESQEMAQVSPAMHAEFVMQYENRLLEPFGLNGYGCCEDLTRKLDTVFTLPNIRRISISPWANVDACAEKLQNKYIFSWKPNPAHLVGNFDIGYVTEYVRHTLEVSKNCIIEIILKDTHTCENRPERFTQWTEAVRRLVEND